MSLQQTATVQTDSEELVHARLAFAERCYINAQELNRSIDLKSNFLLAAVGLLTGAVGLLASSALAGKTSLEWPGILRGAGVLLILVYLLVAFSVVYSATSVYRAVPNVLRPETNAPGMIFPLMLLARFQKDEIPDEEVYLNRLSTASAQDLLHDYANQIVEVSHIYKLKQSEINRSLQRFHWMSVLWIMTMLALVSIAVLAPA